MEEPVFRDLDFNLHIPEICCAAFLLERMQYPLCCFSVNVNSVFEVGNYTFYFVFLGFCSESPKKDVSSKFYSWLWSDF